MTVSYITLKMEAIRSSETRAITYKTTQNRDLKDHYQHFHRREMLKTQLFLSSIKIKYAIKFNWLTS